VVLSLTACQGDYLSRARFGLLPELPDESFPFRRTKYALIRKGLVVAAGAVVVLTPAGDLAERLLARLVKSQGHKNNRRQVDG
jgi:hypothetical protein